LSEFRPIVFRNPADFLVEVSALAARQLNAKVIPDPHLLLEWFALLVQTAIPEDAQLATHPVSHSKAQSGSFFPFMVLADKPKKILALGNFYTPLFGLVNEAEADSLQLERLAKQLKSNEKSFSEAYFSPMDPDSTSFVLIKEGFKSGGWLVDDYFCFGNWYQPVETGNFLGYLAKRPSKLKNTLRRAEKNLNQTSGFRLEIIKEADERLLPAIDAYVQVYNQSWKNPEPFPEFIPGLCQMAARNGWLRLGLILLDNVPIAAQLWLVVEKKAFIVKLAYDQKFVKTSAGTVLTGALFRHVIDVDRVEEVDYLMGDDQYKQDWMSQRRERRGIIAFNPRTPLGIAKAVYHFGGKIMRKYFSFKKLISY
jgi:hypothetical protein